MVGEISLCVLILATWCATGWALSPSPVYVPAQLTLQTVISSDLSKPVFLTHAGDQSHRLFVLEQDGIIRILENGKLLKTPFLDISHLLSTGGERGLLGLAFHPNYDHTGRFFVNYTRAKNGATVIAEYHVSSNPYRSDTQEKILLVIQQPYGNHNGGMIEFGPDKLLYIGMGDGGSGGDPENRAQNRSALLGKILRIDVDDKSPYGIPPENPFVNTKGHPEIFAMGFRNPWRFSFDRETGELWAGDVGQHSWEEINHVKKGKNYGWRLMEGKHCFKPRVGCLLKGNLILPVTEYANRGARCAVTGGYVYRGSLVPSLVGMYLFADFCSGEIFAFKDGYQEVFLDTELQVSSLGEDEKGELYILGHNEGSIHRIVEFTPEKS